MEQTLIHIFNNCGFPEGVIADPSGALASVALLSRTYSDTSSNIAARILLYQGFLRTGFQLSHANPEVLLTRVTSGPCTLQKLHLHLISMFQVSIISIPSAMPFDTVHPTQPVERFTCSSRVGFKQKGKRSAKDLLTCVVLFSQEKSVCDSSCRYFGKVQLRIQMQQLRNTTQQPEGLS